MGLAGRQLGEAVSERWISALLAATRSSRNYFRLFGANPVLGRTFMAEEDQPGGPRVLGMSYGR
jgi:hypothetical protein